MSDELEEIAYLAGRLRDHLPDVVESLRERVQEARFLQQAAAETADPEMKADLEASVNEGRKALRMLSEEADKLNQELIRLDTLVCQHISDVSPCSLPFNARIRDNIDWDQFREDCERIFRRAKEEIAKRKAATIAKPKTSRKKRKTRGESDSAALIGSALRTHHKYSNGSCSNYEPISGADLADLAGVSEASVTRFMQRHFGGQKGYKAACRLRDPLLRRLILIAADLPPFDTYGPTPPGEGRDE